MENISKLRQTAGISTPPFGFEVQPKLSVSMTDGIVTMTVPESLSSQLQSELLTTKESPYGQFRAFKQKAEQIFNLPAFSVVKNFNNDGRFVHGIVFKNLPIDPTLPPTPTDGKNPNKKTFVSEGTLLGICQYLGLPFSFKHEKNGELIHNICPIQGKENSKSNEGYARILDMHTEVAFHPKRPDFVVLVGLKDDPKCQALTFVTDIDEIYHQLSYEDIENLKKSDFLIRAPESFGQDADIVTSVIHQKSEFKIELLLNFDRMMALGKNAEKSLDKLKQIAEKCTHKIHLKPGDMVIIDNRKMVHGRNDFEAIFDGNDRWLQRIYIRAESDQKTTMSVYYPDMAVI